MAERLQTLTSKLVVAADRISTRPDLAPRIAAVMAHWSALEMEVTRIVACLLGTEWRSGMTMYAALEGNAARVAVIKALIAARLPAPLQNRWDDICRRLAAPRDDRNAFAHWLYATSDDHPSDLLLVDPRSEIAWAMEQASNVLKPRIATSHKADIKKMLRCRVVRRYEAQHVRDVAKTIEELTREISDFAIEIQDHILRTA